MPPGIGAEQLHHGGVEGTAGPLRGHRRRRVRAREPVVNLQFIGQAHHPHRERQCLTGEPVRYPSAIPALERVPEPIHHRPAQAEPRGQHPRHLAVTRQAGPPLLRDVAEQLPDHPLAFVCGPTSRERLHHPAGEPVRITVVEVLGVTSERHLVAEQVRVVTRVHGAAQHPQQRQVVQVAEVLAAQPRTPPDLSAQQARPYGMLHRQAQPQIRRYRHDGNHLSKPEPSPHHPSLIHGPQQARQALL
jgi:hypothetical protein